MLTNPELTKKLKKMAKMATEVADLWVQIDDHSMEKYGKTPSEVDNDDFLDSCTGTSGFAQGMTATEFHNSMIKCL